MDQRATESQQKSQPVDLIEVWRGDLLESVHQGHAVICDDTGQIVESWGDPAALVYPRSSAKMIQALPLIESGAADHAHLTSAHLALATASHQGADIHTGPVQDWIAGLGLTDDAFRCGAHAPCDRQARHALIRAGASPCQFHNQCSGKHAGFLTWTKQAGAGPEYLEMDHPLQRAIKLAVEETADQDSPHWGIDGCSAPNHAVTMQGMARAMAGFAASDGRSGARAKAQHRLVTAMMTHPELVNGEGEACTTLMRDAREPVAVKGGAEGYYVAILPRRKWGIALKIADGSDRAKQSAMASLLVRIGALDPGHPLVDPDLHNWAGLKTGGLRASAALRPVST